ncbi:MAG: 4-hydroxybutyrate CoA-transferase [Bacteroidales bacterium]|nr:4-hydroxybutyrate CoA-transferase [Bacteroidales bacterium]
MKPIRFVSADEAVKAVKSGDHVHFSGVAGFPQILADALCRRGENGDLRDVRIHHLHTEGRADYADERFSGIFFNQSFFVGANVRKAVQEGWADYIPISLSETQKLYRQHVIPVDVAMIMVTPPDRHGYVSLGPSVGTTLAAVQNAKTVIAVVNENMPRTWGHSIIPVDDIDIWVEDHSPLFQATQPPVSDTDVQIGKHVACLVEDGACLQMGIGSIPNAVLAQLDNHKNLGIHTEMFSDGVLPLVERGVINGSNKIVRRNRIVATFVMGSKKVYDFVDDNPGVYMMDVKYSNSPNSIAMNPKVCAINSALQVDVTGQVCADSIGTKFYSGCGGQVDFMMGASMSKGGKAIIAMPSATLKGVSKIVPTLTEGAGVVTPRNLVHYLVTEYGAVNLYGKSLQERAKLIISIAHPSAQEDLDRAAFERFGPHYHTF